MSSSINEKKNKNGLENNMLKPRPRGTRNKRSVLYPERKSSINKKADLRENTFFTEKDILEYKRKDEQTDASWYQREDGLDDDENFGNIFPGDQSEYAKFEDDIEKINRAHKMGTVYRHRKSQKARILEKDQTKWEQNRIENAGLGGFDYFDEVIDNEEEGSANVLVLDAKPAFLEGKKVEAHQRNSVSVVKDPNSDLSIIAKKGSLLLKEIRKKRERTKNQNRIWELAGSKQGDVLNVKENKREEANTKETNVKCDGTVDYKSSSSYSKLRKIKDAKASTFSTEKSLREQREYLPIFKVRDKFLRHARDNQVIVVVGETGSGKTTQLTQYLLEEGLAEHGLIGCTQPRRVAAMTVAKRVSKERGGKLGEEVGYAIRFEDCTSEATRIKYLTDGVLLRESLRSPDLDDYSVIIMDEAHERSLHTDILFGLLKEICCRRLDLKLIVTSATLDAEHFARFFGNAPVFNVTGRTFPVEILFSKNVCEDYLDSAIKQILTIHLTQPDGDILVFMTGQEDIEAVCEYTKARLDKVGCEKELLIIPIYSALPSELQAKVFEKTPENSRKCIVATNIAETSLTVDGIRYVIDCGFCKLKVYNPRIGMDSLQVTPISRANADQRSGRAGRTAAGFAYRMYTLLSYNSEMFASTVPEIQRTNLGNVVLLLKSLGIKDLLKFEFMDPPPEENILSSMYQLWVLGALGGDGVLTKLGREMVEFPLDPSLSKMLVFSASQGCSLEIITIVSMLSVPSIYYRPADKANESDAAREKFVVPESDHLTLFRVYEVWKSKGYTEKWCREHFIHYKAMTRVREVRSQLMDIMKQRKLPIKSCDFNYDLVRKSICSAYFHHAVKMKGIGSYVNIQSRMPCMLHPSSGLYGLGHTPEYLVYHELVLTSREYMRTVTEIDPKWLAELGPTFFAIRNDRKRIKGERPNKISFVKTCVINGPPQKEKESKIN